uniref:Uncharacterized protein n=1 Tax=Aegilops tauschii subsp. strangulata TaxID=200361 RepID=A0A453M631_AEGTS
MSMQPPDLEKKSRAATTLLASHTMRMTKRNKESTAREHQETTERKVTR